MNASHQLGSFATRVGAAITPLEHGDGLWIADEPLESLFRQAFELQATTEATAHAADLIALGLHAKQLVGPHRMALLAYQLFALVAALVGEAEAEHKFERADLTQQRTLGQTQATNRPVPSGGPSVLDLRIGRKP